MCRNGVNDNQWSYTFITINIVTKYWLVCFLLCFKNYKIVIILWSIDDTASMRWEQMVMWREGVACRKTLHHVFSELFDFQKCFWYVLNYVRVWFEHLWITASVLLFLNRLVFWNIFFPIIQTTAVQRFLSRFEIPIPAIIYMRFYPELYRGQLTNTCDRIDRSVLQDRCQVAGVKKQSWRWRRRLRGLLLLQQSQIDAGDCKYTFSSWENYSHEKPRRFVHGWLGLANT